jgi:hypothetical protein
MYRAASGGTQAGQQQAYTGGTQSDSGKSQDGEVTDVDFEEVK